MTPRRPAACRCASRGSRRAARRCCRGLKLAALGLALALTGSIAGAAPQASPPGQAPPTGPAPATGPASASGQAEAAPPSTPSDPLAALRRAARMGPLPKDGLLALARAEAAAGNRSAAEGHLAEAVRRFDSVQARMMLAQLQAESGRGARGLEQALETVRGALDAAPNSEEVISVYARLSLAGGAPAPALRALEALVRMHPQVAEHRYLLGVALMQLGDLARAREVLEASLSIAAPDDPARPRTHTALGLVLNQLDRFDAARASLETALRLAPDDLDTLAALAEAEAGAGDAAAAEGHARRVLDRAPQGSNAFATAHLALGRVRMEQGRFEEARDSLEAAVAADPGSSKAHYQLSLAYARLGDRERSAHHAELSRRAQRAGEENLLRLRGTAPDASPEDEP